MNPNKQSSGMMHFKSAQIAGVELGPNDMVQINKYTLSPLAPEDVFAFKVSMAANEVDRDYEVFPRTTLSKLANLFVGKTVVKDHDHKSDNQIARIYATDLVESNHMHLTKGGEIFTELIAKCYMVKTSTNADLISEIRAGIRKEVSLGCRIGKAVCSICDTDNVKTYCTHFGGKQYEGNTCYFSLEDPQDAYELSFVAIPAQQHAGTVKAYGEKPCYKTDVDAKEKAEKSLDKQSEQTQPEQARLTVNQEKQRENDCEEGNRCYDPLTVNQEDDTQFGQMEQELHDIALKMNKILELLTKNAAETPVIDQNIADSARKDSDIAAENIENTLESEDSAAGNSALQEEPDRLTVNQDKAEDHSNEHSDAVQEKEMADDPQELTSEPEDEHPTDGDSDQSEGPNRLMINRDQDLEQLSDEQVPNDETLAAEEEESTATEQQDASTQSEKTEEDETLKSKQALARLRALELAISLRNHIKR